MFPLLPTQLTTAKFTIVNLEKPATRQNSFTIVNLTFAIIYYSKIWSVGSRPMYYNYKNLTFIFVYNNILTGGSLTK